MSEMEKTLPSKKFLRVHKSYIIALASIKSIYGNSIEVNKTTIPIGINHKDKVLQLTGRKL
jgi:DNA-binding LytR/AlgR family response regulator